MTDIISPENEAFATGAAGRPGAGVVPRRALARPAKKKLGLFFWICAGWIGLVILVAIFANLLPLPNPDYQNFAAPQNGAPGLGSPARHRRPQPRHLQPPALRGPGVAGRRLRGDRSSA